MTILGIDQSLTNTGFCVLNESRIVKIGSISPDYNKNKWGRISEIIDSIIQVATKNGIDVMAREGFSYASQGQAYQLGGLGYSIDLAILETFPSVKLLVVPPTILKKFVVGKGNAKKDEMLLWTYKAFKLEFKNSDECEAFCLAKFAQDYLIWKENKNIFPKYRQEEFKIFQKYLKLEGLEK